jgi:hypothetical protein
VCGTGYYRDSGSGPCLPCAAAGGSPVVLVLLIVAFGVVMILGGLYMARKGGKKFARVMTVGHIVARAQGVEDIFGEDDDGGGDDGGGGGEGPADGGEGFGGVGWW